MAPIRIVTVYGKCAALDVSVIVEGTCAPATMARLTRPRLIMWFYAPLRWHLRHNAWRKNVTGIAPGPPPLFWDVSKTGWDITMEADPKQAWCWASASNIARIVPRPEAELRFSGRRANVRVAVGERGGLTWKEFAVSEFAVPPLHFPARFNKIAVTLRRELHHKPLNARQEKSLNRRWRTDFREIRCYFPC